MTGKVKLPREVADALEEVLESSVYDKELVAWAIPVNGDRGGKWKVLFDFSNKQTGFFKLVDALRYGYEIEAEPITVTATAEQQEGLKNYYELLDPADQVDKNDAEYIRGERAGIRYALAFLGIKIPGIPEEDLTDVKVFEEANDR